MADNIVKTVNWCGHDIRFIEINGEWWAILKAICDALGLKTFKVSFIVQDMVYISEYTCTLKNNPYSLKQSNSWKQRAEWQLPGN